MTALLDPTTSSATPPASGGSTAFTGTGVLLRLAVRRDRVRATIWTLGLLAVVYSQAAATVGLYPEQADLDRLAAAYARNVNPGIAAITGPPIGLDTWGGATAWQLVVFQATLLALMSYLMVVRHTRAEEEAGRTDLVDAAPVGRYARLAAALTYAGLLNVVVAVLTVLLLVATGLDATGSAAMALACGSTGIVFAAIGALTAQLTERSRPANGLAGALLGVAFLLRAAGDTAEVSGGSGSWLTWLSPLGWAELVRSYAENRWWVLALPLGTALVVLVGVAVLRARRDAGAGILASRPGRASAPASLRGPFGLAWRLHRGSIVGWSIGTAITGAVFGGLAEDIVAAARDDEATADALTSYAGSSGSIGDVYLAVEFALVGMVVAGFAVQAVLRVRSEETDLRAEPLLATAVSRSSWAGSHVLLAAIGSAVVLAAAGLASGLAYGIRSGEYDAGGRLFVAALAQLPAVWVVAAVGVALFGLAPRWTIGTWGVLLVSVFVSQLGPTLRLDQWLLNVSPFSHLPKLPAVDATAAPYLWLLALTGALTVAGLIGLRRRDIR